MHLLVELPDRKATPLIQAEGAEQTQLPPEVQIVAQTRLRGTFSLLC